MYYSCIFEVEYDGICSICMWEGDRCYRVGFTLYDCMIDCKGLYARTDVEVVKMDVLYVVDTLIKDVNCIVMILEITEKHQDTRVAFESMRGYGQSASFVQGYKTTK